MQKREDILKSAQMELDQRSQRLEELETALAQKDEAVKQLRQKVMELENEPDAAVPESRKVLAAQMQHVSPVNLQRAGVRCGQCAQNLKQCGLSRA